MKNLFKILPIVAIVVALGSAWAYQADDPCTTRGTQSYDTPPNPEAPLDDPTNDEIVSLGKFEINFECGASSNTCHWVYEPSSPLANPAGWIICLGDFEEL